MSTTTDKLRRMLDECGIEYEQDCIEGIAEYTLVTKWKTQTYNKCTFYEVEDGHPPYYTRMFIETPTAAQAIAATVGRETCHDVGDARIFHCSECGFGLEDVYLSDESYFFDDDGEWIDPWPPSCPNCGRRVVES